MIQLRERMQGEARLQIALARMDGHKVDKKICRYNDIVDCAMDYGYLGCEFNLGAAWGGFRDAIDSCIIGDPMNSGRPCTEIVYDWMRK